PVLALAGCELGSTEPVSLSLEFEGAHTLNADGTCRVVYTASAFGIGRARWDRVIVRESGSVVAQYSGAETAQFWGQVDISAGQRLTSAPYVAPDAGEDVVIDVFYRVTGPERQVTLAPNCTAETT